MLTDTNDLFAMMGMKKFSILDADKSEADTADGPNESEATKSDSQGVDVKLECVACSSGTVRLSFKFFRQAVEIQ